VPWLAGRDGRLRAVVDWRDPAVRRVFALMLPVSLGLGLINFNALVATFFAARYIDPEIAPTAIDKAFRVYMLPQGMFSVAVATVLFPLLARLVARDDMDDFRHTVSLGLRQIGFLLIPASVVCAVLAHPIIRLLYERGEFEPDQTPIVANALAAFSLGLAFNGAMLMLNRAFFSLQAPWTPTILALGTLALNTLLNFALYPVGTWGLPLATSFSNIAGTAALLFVLNRRLRRLELRETTASATRVILASAPLAAVSFLVWWALDELLGRSFVAQVISVGAALAAGTAVYVICCRLLRVRELEALLTLRSRFRRA
jgi:putative peptidoglycan lipid II flippase